MADDLTATKPGLDLDALTRVLSTCEHHQITVTSLATDVPRGAVYLRVATAEQLRTLLLAIDGPAPQHDASLSCVGGEPALHAVHRFYDNVFYLRHDVGCEAGR